MSEFTLTQKQSKTNKTRESGVELLRCLAIFFVVVIHEVPVFFADNPDALFVLILRIIAWPAIFCFAFITGYFLIIKNNDENKTKRFLWLTLEIVIWRVVISVFALLVVTLANQDSPQKFGYQLSEIFKSLIDYRFWYFWAVIFVYLIFPFLSYYLQNNYSKGKKIIKWLVIFFFLISFFATLGSLLDVYLGIGNFSIYTDQYTIVIVFFAALLGGYWHLIEQDRKIQSDWKLQLVGLGGLLVVYFINFSLGWWGNNHDTALSYLNFLWYFAGFFYFLIFKNFHFQSKIVNWWAGLSWWIYILHNGGHLPRGWAWQLIDLAKLDPYSSAILTIFLCYFLAIILTLLVQNFDNFVVKPYLIQPLKNSWSQKHQKTITKIKN